ncbi:hypothetical protein LOC68_21100 [Blastopirellula sp. JC732]|uniref:Uncharacterized protein n=1 Tax=Blastopirellula sediminis TaxID=2894196 RepID=A0A9X1SIJ6_9BACT|nr:Lpg1974 family pore-forming outer membrane protein [Blastopirellula sediminis]MCC9605804.1 hypothetical protein [Blastopirellula sediminis]MCC9630896.1 hypothetical protein [Blastopirellula sediminis]
MKHAFFVGLTLALVVSMAVAASAEEDVKLMSYDDLLVRMENLERQVQSQSQSQPVSLYSEQTSDFAAQGYSPCACAQQPKCGKWYVGYESVFVTPFQSNNTGIIAQNDPVIEHIGFDWDMEQSNRIELGYLAPTCGMGWRARYWQFSHSSTFDVDSNNGLTQDEGAIIWASTDDGGTVLGLVDVDTAVITQSMDVYVLDLELQKQATKSFLVSGGFRYAELDQRYRAVTDEGIAASEMQFQGYGPTIAVEYQKPVYGRLGWYGNGRTSLLFGKQSFALATDGSDKQLLIDNSAALAGAVEMQLGLKWTSRNGHFFLKSGLETQYWANVGSPNPSAIYTDDSDEANVDDVMNESLGFVGFTFGGGFQY